MRVSVPIDSSDAKATSSGDTTRRDGFGTPHAGANTNVSNGPTDAHFTDADKYGIGNCSGFEKENWTYALKGSFCCEHYQQR